MDQASGWKLKQLPGVSPPGAFVNPIWGSTKTGLGVGVGLLTAKQSNTESLFDLLHFPGAVAPIHRFLGGQNFLWSRGNFFLRRHAKSPRSAPPIASNLCTKMY